MAMQMWPESKEFSLNVKTGWKLHLGESVHIPVPEGFYYGRISKNECGFEIRTDKNFLSKKPMYLFMQQPHPQLMDFLSVKQEIYARDDCGGFVPESLRYRGVPNLCSFLGHLFSRLRNISEFGATANFYAGVDYVTYENDGEYVLEYENEAEEEQKIRNIRLPNNESCDITDCAYLGEICTESVTLCQIIERELYAVHTKSNRLVGYLFTVGIWGTDLKKAHSDEGYYAVAVILPNDKNEANFISLLGMQNELDVYQLDELDGRVDWRDLEWFDERAEQYLNFKQRERPDYVNLKTTSYGSHSLRPGTYVIEPCILKQKFPRNCGKYFSECKAEGQDSLGRKYNFPDKMFTLKRLTDKQEIEECKDYLINVSESSVLCLWWGNLVISKEWFAKSENKYEWTDDAIFRMYTDLDRVESHAGHLTEYDLDPNKTLEKLVQAYKKAHEEYYYLPPKESCCNECDKNDYRKRCPKLLSNYM